MPNTAQKPEAKPTTTIVTVVRDIWTETGERIRKGDLYEAEMTVAMDLVEAGKVTRVR